jgi:O-antigen/teichoic acid export membrane protein
MAPEPQPSARLFTPAQIGLATFLGAPLAAGWLMARNYRALEEKKKEKRCLIYATLGTTAVMALAFVLPDNFPNTALPIGYTIGIVQIAKQVQGPMIDAHLARGGSAGSWWATVGIGLLSLLIVIVVFFPVAYFLLPDE